MNEMKILHEDHEVTLSESSKPAMALECYVAKAERHIKHCYTTEPENFQLLPLLRSELLSSIKELSV